MPSRRRVLATTGSALAASIAGCASLAAPDHQVWRYTFEGRAPAAPTVADGTVLLAAATPGLTTTDGRLHAVDAATGERRWRVDIPEPLTEPAVRDGVVAVGTGDSIVGRGRETGARRWRVDAGPTGAAALAATNDGFHAALRDVGLLSLTADGDVRWRVDAPTVAALAAGSDVVLGVERPDQGTTRVVARRPAAAGRRWAMRIRDTASLAVAGGDAYVASDRLLVRDATTGAARWTFAPDDERVTTTPIVRNGVVFIGTEAPRSESDHGGVYRLREGARSGEYRPADALLTLAGDDRGLFIMGGETLQAVDPTEMRVRWRLDAPYGPLAARDGRCYLAEGDHPDDTVPGRLRAFDGRP